MSAFTLQKIAFFGKNGVFIQRNSMATVLDTFSSVFSFCKVKGYYC